MEIPVGYLCFLNNKLFMPFIIQFYRQLYHCIITFFSSIMQSKPTSSAPALKPKIGTAALAFNDEDEDEEEEMPPEAKMRMKNIGRFVKCSSILINIFIYIYMYICKNIFLVLL